jgi:hypothetical protein
MHNSNPKKQRSRFLNKKMLRHETFNKKNNKKHDRDNPFKRKVIEREQRWNNFY